MCVTTQEVDEQLPVYGSSKRLALKKQQIRVSIDSDGNSTTQAAHLLQWSVA